ncbi:MAG: hypothetical protein AB1416_09000 [Actinomycetota bacterium]
MPPAFSRSTQPVDAFCRVVRCTVGSSQVEALARLHDGDDARRVALQQAVMASAWSRAMPGEPAAGWMRVVQPIAPPMEDVEPDRQMLVLVAGLRRTIAEAAVDGNEEALARLTAAREAFGEPRRDEILRLLHEAYVQTE